jgi:hypothetical protein
MPPADPALTLLDAHLEPLVAWERSLRPTTSPSLFVVTVGVLAVLAACLALAAYCLDWGLPLQPRPLEASPPRSLPVAPPPVVVDDDSASRHSAVPPVEIVTKCMTRGGRAVYSDSSCPDRTTAGSVAIHPEINLADGMSLAARAASLRDNAEVAQQLAAHERRVAMNVDRAVAECASLEAAITGLDAEARRPLSAFQQDRIKDERAWVRNRQFALRCQ